MYASQLHVHGYHPVPDQRTVSQQAAERHRQLTAVSEAPRRRDGARREGRARARQRWVPVA